MTGTDGAVFAGVAGADVAGAVSADLRAMPASCNMCMNASLSYAGAAASAQLTPGLTTCGGLDVETRGLVNSSGGVSTGGVETTGGVNLSFTSLSD